MTMHTPRDGMTPAGGRMNEQQTTFDDIADNPFHSVACIVCGNIEPHWVDVFICDHCHVSGRAAVEFDTLQQMNELLKHDLSAYEREAAQEAE